MIVLMHARTYLRETARIAESLDAERGDALAGELAALRERGGRLFLLGVGGSAANCGIPSSFRKWAAG